MRKDMRHRESKGLEQGWKMVGDKYEYGGTFDNELPNGEKHIRDLAFPRTLN